MRTFKSFKGFNKDLSCKGYHYVEGQTYEMPEEDINLCTKGFHSCIIPLQCYHYYTPLSGVFHDVDISGAMEISKSNSKIVSSKITIGHDMSAKSIIERTFDVIESIDNDPDQYAGTELEEFAYNINESCRKGSIVRSDMDFSIAACDKEDPVYNGLCINTSHHSIAASIGNHKGVAVSQGMTVAASVGKNNIVCSSGSNSIVASIGPSNTVLAQEKGCIGVGIGGVNRLVAQEEGSMVMACGDNSVAKGALNSFITFAHMSTDDQNKSFIDKAITIKIDGVTFKADTWYKLEDGEIRPA